MSCVDAMAVASSLGSNIGSRLGHYQLPTMLCEKLPYEVRNQLKRSAAYISIGHSGQIVIQ
jgi:hypothetical protein